MTATPETLLSCPKVRLPKQIKFDSDKIGEVLEITENERNVDLNSPKSS